MADRGRFLQIASGSARECGAILDILHRCDVVDRATLREGKERLIRIVSMLSRMTEPREQIKEERVVYGERNDESSSVHVHSEAVHVTVHGK